MSSRTIRVRALAGSFAHTSRLPVPGRSDQLRDQALGVGVPDSKVCSSLPGLKRTAFPGVILTSVPVRGLRPIPVLRARTLNTPKPRNSMRSPAARASFKPSNTVSTAASALVRGRPVRSITWCTMSCLIKAVTSLARLFLDCTTPYRIDGTAFGSFVKPCHPRFLHRVTRRRQSSSLLTCVPDHVLTRDVAENPSFVTLEIGNKTLSDGKTYAKESLCQILLFQGNQH